MGDPIQREAEHAGLFGSRRVHQFTVGTLDAASMAGSIFDGFPIYGKPECDFQS